MNADTPDALLPPRIDVVEINAYAPRPFVFSEIALCLRDALRRAGVASRHLVNRSEPGVPCIVFVPTDGWEAFVANLDPHQTVLFNMEQLGSDAPWTRDGYVESLKRWTVADYNASNVDWLRRHNGPAQRVQEIPIVPGPSVAFAVPPTAEPPTDVLFFGTMNPRREQVIARLREAGLSVEVVAGAFGWELTPAILRARLVLHVHFYETRLFPVARIVQPVAQGVPIVCENSVCSPLADWSSGSASRSPRPTGSSKPAANCWPTRASAARRPAELALCPAAGCGGVAARVVGGVEPGGVNASRRRPREAVNGPVAPACRDDSRRRRPGRRHCAAQRALDDLCAHHTSF